MSTCAVRGLIDRIYILQGIILKKKIAGGNPKLGNFAGGKTLFTQNRFIWYCISYLEKNFQSESSKEEEE
jgi:hypothetical protein